MSVTSVLRSSKVRNDVLGTIAALGVIGAIAGGSFIGVGKLAMDSAYARTHISTISSMSKTMLKEVAYARSNFVLGAAEGVEIDLLTKLKHRKYAEGFGPGDDTSDLGSEYFAAGKAWREEIGISDEALTEVARIALEANDEIFRTRETGVEKLTSAGMDPHDAEYLVSAAMFRGMLDATSGVLSLDERTDRRVTRLLSNADEAVAEVLGEVRDKSFTALETEAGGNSRMFAHLQNVLNRMPADLASFSVPIHRRMPLIRKDVGVNKSVPGSRVAEVDPQDAPLSPRIIGTEKDEPGF